MWLPGGNQPGMYHDISLEVTWLSREYAEYTTISGAFEIMASHGTVTKFGPGEFGSGGLNLLVSRIGEFCPRDHENVVSEF